MPERLVVLGGGVVGVEMAQAWKRLGAREVTVVEGGERLVANLEPFAGDELRAAFEEEGIAVILGREGGARRTARRRHRAGARSRSTTAAPSSATSCSSPSVGGRTPPTSAWTRWGWSRARRSRSTTSSAPRASPGGWLYAVGDVNGRVLLTHMGKYQARHRRRRDPEGIEPWRRGPTTGRCRASCSRIRSSRSVGLTEREAREQGIDVRVVQLRHR